MSSEAEPSPTLDRAVDARVRIRGRDIADACVDGSALSHGADGRADARNPLADLTSSRKGRQSSGLGGRSIARHAHAATTRKSESRSERSTMTSLRTLARSGCCGQARNRSNSVQLSVQAKRREGERGKVRPV